MDIIYASVIGILLVCVLVVLVLKFLSPSYSYKPKVGEVVDKLVNQMAPKYDGKDFDRDDLNKSMGEMVDIEMYYNFKKLLNAGKLSSHSLMNTIV